MVKYSTEQKINGNNNKNNINSEIENLKKCSHENIKISNCNWGPQIEWKNSNTHIEVIPGKIRPYSVFVGFIYLHSRLYMYKHYSKVYGRDSH